MSSENRSNSALHKRADQLRRWEQSETCQDISNLKRTSCRISFSDGCVFLAACAAGDKDEVCQLLAKGVDINTSNIDGLTALHQACIDDNLDMVEFLVESDADVNRGDNEGWTPLHATASCGFLSIARYLLDQYADVAAVNNDGELAIDICETNEMADLLQHEIDVRGINCDESRMEEENRLLTDARQWYNDGHVTEVPHPKTGATSVHVAAAKGYVQALSLLLKAGADINAQDCDGWTPLHAAAHWAQREPCQILAENLCNMDIKNYVGQTAFDISDPEVLTTLEQLQHKQYAMLKERPEIGHILKRQPMAPFKRRPSAARLSHSERTALVTLDAATERQRLQDHWNECEAALMAAGSPTSASTTSTSEPVVAPSTTVSHPRTALASSAAEMTPKITDAQLSNVASQEAPIPVPRCGASVPPAPSFTPRPLDGSEGPPTAAASSDSWRRHAGSNNSSGPPAVQPLAQHPSRTMDGVETAAMASTLPSVDPPKSTTPAEQTASATIIQAPSTGVSSSPVVRRQSSATQPADKLDSASKLNPTNILKNIFKSFVPPVRDEESETQRKAHAKRVRETRRSTQGVTLEELKSAEQYVKSQQQHQQPHQPAVATTGSVPSSTPSSATSMQGSTTTAASTGVSGGTTTAPSREEMAAAMERRPSWRLRVDDNDRNKFSLEEVRAVSAVAAGSASLVGDGDSCLQSTASSASASATSSAADATPSETTSVTLPLRRKSSGGPSAAASAQLQLQQQQQALQQQQSPPKATSADEDKENDSRSAAATQAAIQRRRKPKRRSTGVVQFGLEENDKGVSTVVAGRNADGADSATLAAGVAHNDDHSSKASPVPTSASVENGVVDYKKLYEEAMVDNERLRQRLVAMETEFREAKQQSDKSVQMANSRVAAVESDKRENRALERKLAEMEEELKMMEELRTENRRLRDENGALIRVISKLSK